MRRSQATLVPLSLKSTYRFSSGSSFEILVFLLRTEDRAQKGDFLWLTLEQAEVMRYVELWGLS